MDADPVTRELVRNALISIADSMAITLVRTARSQTVRDAMDCAAGLFCRHGEAVAQGLTHPVSWGMMQPALQAGMDAFPGRIEDGDVFIVNDPYTGGGHLPDIMLFKPVYVGGVHLGWVGAEGHHADIGGRVAGGVATDNTEIFQEGLQIPPLKLYERGTLNTGLWKIIERNVRVPQKVMGDLLGQLAAMRTGEQELLRVAHHFGVEATIGYMEDILDASEQLVRSELAALPDGQWEFTDHIDEDGLDPDPIAIHVTISKKGDTLSVDFTGTSPQAPGSINCDFTTTKSFVFSVIKSILSTDAPVNGGTFRPITIRAPEGCFVNPKRPGAVSARGLGGQRAAATLFGAFAQALPHKVPADWGCGSPGVTFTGFTEQGQQFVCTEFLHGTRGGGPDRDADDGMIVPILNTANVPVETLEAEEPLLIERYGLVPDTGGAGKFRGSLAIIRQYRTILDKTYLRVRSDRRKFLPWGLQGGKAGTPLQNTLNPESKNILLPGKFQQVLKKDDVYRLVLAGGGGFGDPLERDPHAVLEDVRQDKLSVKYASREYGVVLHQETLTLDLPATIVLRAALRKGREANTAERG